MNMKHLCFFSFCIILALPVFSPRIFAQTAAELETLLYTDAVNYGQAARFVLLAADISNSSPEDAFRYAKEQNWLPAAAIPETSAKLDGVSLLIMRAFNMNGGALYTLAKTPHYAYRELTYQNIIQGRADPKMTVSGDLLLFLVNRLLSREETEDALTPQRTEPVKLTTEHEETQTRQLALAEEINIQLEALAVADTSARVTGEGVTISLSNIQFLANSAELPEPEKEKLREIAQILTTIPIRRISVAGHTALAGTAQDQMKTSLERAQAAADYLVSLGVREADEIEVHGYGSQQPIADNNTFEGMALNRRVEITILKDQ
jgi:outer membrane protein OmpA-like peptidoglycan-associated protein